MVLPNETLVDVFRWLDRRFLDTKLRLASRRANAIVGLLDKFGPKLWLPELQVKPSTGNMFFRMASCAPLTDGHEQKPFDTYSPDAIPPYIYFESVDIGVLYDHYVTTKADSSSRDDCLCFFVTSPGDITNVTLYERAWGRSVRYPLHHCTNNDGPLFDSCLLRTCLKLCVFDSPPVNPQLLLRWLRTPAEPCAWNPKPSRDDIKFLELSADSQTLARLYEAIKTDFENSKSPCNFHFEMYTEDGILLPSYPRRKNDKTDEVLFVKTGKFSDNVWRLSTAIESADESSFLAKYYPVATRQWPFMKETELSRRNPFIDILRARFGRSYG